MHASSDIFISQGDYSIFKVTEEIKRHTLHSHDNIIGIHIRRTDNEMSVRYSPTELFIRKIEEEINVNPTQQLYLATDDKTEEKHLLQMFPTISPFMRNRVLTATTPSQYVMQL